MRCGMSTIMYSIFNNKKVNLSRLLQFGFVQTESGYIYRKTLSESGFLLNVHVTPQGEISTEMIDPSLNELYTLHLVDNATGGFVETVKYEYQETLLEIASQCFQADIFQSKQSNELIDYVRKTYGDELEFLWEKFPKNAIWRRKDTQKWYGILLTVSKQKLGFPCDESVEVLDFRVLPEELESLVDYKTYFPGYHMNKKHWCTIILDGSVSFEEICSRIDASYLLAIK